MASEPATAPVAPESAPDTPELAASGAPETPAPEQTIDYEKRYNDLRPQWDRSNQVLSTLGINDAWVEAFNDPDTQEEALDWLVRRHGYDVADAVADELGTDEPDDTRDLRDPRVDEILARQESEDTEKLSGEIEDHIQSLAAEKKIKLTPKQAHAIFNEAVDRGPSPDSTQEVFDEWVEDQAAFKDSVIEDYRKSKSSASPPPPSAGPGTPDVPIDDRKARRNRMMEAADRAYAAS